MLLSLITGPAALLTLTTLTVALLLLLGARRATSTPPACPPLTRRILRQRTLRTAFLRVTDPDDAGRPRPRAPSPA